MGARDFVKKRHQMPTDILHPFGGKAMRFLKPEVDSKNHPRFSNGIGRQNADATRLDPVAEGVGGFGPQNVALCGNQCVVIADQRASERHQLQRQRGLS